jgi:hypothetical protein
MLQIQARTDTKGGKRKKGDDGRGPDKRQRMSKARNFE